MGVLTAPLAGAYFLGFLGVIRTCRKSPTKSSRKVDIIGFYQTESAPRLPYSAPGWGTGRG